MLSSLFGKILFSLFDLFCGFLIYRIFRYQRMKAETATFYASFWILNPFVMFISTRGSADTIVCFLVYCTLYFLQTGWIGCSAFVYGLAIHFKLFPVIYALIFFLYVRSQGKSAIMFALLTICSFSFFTIGSWTFYGKEYLNKALLYHATRLDYHHSYSLLFYSSYLSDKTSTYLSFLVQALLLLILSIRRYHQVFLAVVVASLLFVTFNRVVTAQYFLWWLAPLILEIPSSSLSILQWVGLIGVFLITQNVWNAIAYQLEFNGINLFLPLWCACVLIFVVNCVMIVLLLRRHQECSFGFQESSSQSLLDKKTHCRVCSTYQQYPFSFSFMTYHSKSSRKELKQSIPFAPTPLRIPSLRNQTTSFPLLITSLRRSHRYQISQILSAYPTALAQPLLEVTLSFSFHSRSNLLQFLHPLFMETNSGIHSLLHFHTDVPISCSFKVMMDLNNNTTLHTPITILQKAFNSSFLPTTIFLLFLYQFISTSI